MSAEARDDLRRIVARDVDDLRYVEVEFEAVGRAHGDRRQIRVEPVRFGLAGRPVQHDVGRRHVDDLVRVGIDRVFARIQRLDPDAFLAFAHEIAVPELLAGDVLAFLADEGDDDADVRDRHLGHVDDLDGREARVDEVAAGQQDLLLQSLAAADCR